MRSRAMLVGLVWLAACGGGDGDGPVDAARPADARAADAATSPPDATIVDAAIPDAPGPDAIPETSGGALLVTKTPGGNAPIGAWDGVLLFHIPYTGGPAEQAADIPKEQVRDPAGLAFRPAASEVLVGNRHGNTAANGTVGSISRFAYDPVARTFTAQGEITGNGLARVHQLFVSPSGELFAVNRDSGVSRFTFMPDGTAVANGTIGSGAARGVAVSPDGTRMYMTGASNSIRQFDVATGMELAAVTLGTSGNLHYMAIRQDQLYVAALADNKVYRYDIEADNSLTFVDGFDAAGAIAVAFSEDETEMFVSGHLTSDIVSRFAYDAAGDTWTHTTDIDVAVSLGGVAVLPTRTE